jgi:hypothetical protein
VDRKKAPDLMHKRVKISIGGVAQSYIANLGIELTTILRKFHLPFFFHDENI